MGPLGESRGNPRDRMGFPGGHYNIRDTAGIYLTGIPSYSTRIPAGLLAGTHGTPRPESTCVLEQYPRIIGCSPGFLVSAGYNAGSDGIYKESTGLGMSPVVTDEKPTHTAPGFHESRAFSVRAHGNSKQHRVILPACHYMQPDSTRRIYMALASICHTIMSGSKGTSNICVWRFHRLYGSGIYFMRKLSFDFYKTANATGARYVTESQFRSMLVLSNSQ